MAANSVIDAECDSCVGSDCTSIMSTHEHLRSTDLLYQLNELSPDDKELLRSCWRHLSKRKEEVAVEAFILIFKQCPETKKLFYFIDDDQPATSSKRMKDDNAFQFHALRFIQIVESMIENLDNLSSVETILHSLGQLHLRFREKFGFQTYYWSVFCECTLFTFRERLKHRIEDIDRAVTLWRIVLGAIKQKMRQGFHAGDRKRRALLASNVSQTSQGGWPAPQCSHASPEPRHTRPARSQENLDGDSHNSCEIGVQATNDLVL